MKRQVLTIIEKEGKVFERAMKAMGTIIPLEYRVEGDCGGYDHLVRGKMLGHPFVWCVEEKKHLTKADEPRTLLNKDKAPHPFLLATEYVPQEAAERLREAGIQFIDTVGNAFINQPPVLIYVKGNKPDKPEPKPQAGRLFKGVGLRVIYALLRRPELIEWPYRDLAETTGVALGTVKNTMADLTEKGFILDRENREKAPEQERAFRALGDSLSRRIKAKTPAGTIPW